MKSNKIRLGEQCVVTSSKRFHLSERITQGVPFYCSKEIIKKFNGEDVTECDYISEDLYKKVSNEFGVPKENDLLITTRGTIGIPYLYKRTDRFYFADGNLTWIKDFDSNLYSKFLYYWFQSYEGRKKFEALAKGTAQKAVPISGIKTLEIELPSLKSQKRIADILSAYDDLIENNQKQIKLLKEAAQRLYKEWFVDLHFPGHENTKIVDGVPEGWRRGLLKELISVNYGKDHKKVPDDGNIPVYGSGGLMRKCNKSLFSGEAVLIPRKGSLNNIMYVDETFWTVDTMFYATMKQPHTAVFVYFFVKAFDMYSMNIGAAVPSMTTKILDAMDVVIPDKETLEKFDKYAKVYFNKIKTLQGQNEQLKTARDLLLPKLMSGEVEV
jgi:type I restriction enzyme S subunit